MGYVWKCVIAAFICSRLNIRSLIPSFWDFASAWVCANVLKSWDEYWNKYVDWPFGEEFECYAVLNLKRLRMWTLKFLSLIGMYCYPVRRTNVWERIKRLAYGYTHLFHLERFLCHSDIMLVFLTNKNWLFLISVQCLCGILVA